MSCDDGDGHFGPALNCEQFDFTLYFEQAVISTGVSALFLILWLFKIKTCYGIPATTRWSLLQVAKLLLAVAVVAIDIALLVMRSQDSKTPASVSSTALEVLAALAVVVLEIFEHNRSPRPSTLVSLYLVATITGDAVQLRTLVLRNYAPTVTRLLSANVGLKSALLFLESWPKAQHLVPTEGGYGPEETAGVLSRSVFWWLNPMLLRGNRNILALDQLLSLDRWMRSPVLQERLQHSWDKNKLRKPYPLVVSSVACFKWRLVWTMAPRAAMVGFGYAQTFLIEATIHYLERPQKDRDIRNGHGLIAAAALIYLGIAVSTANYNQKLYRTITAYRGATSSLIFNRIFSKKAGYNGKAAITLMSTDIDRTIISITKAADLWALTIEVAIGVWLLWRQMGAIAVAPITITALCFALQTWMSKYIGPKQAQWVRAIQRRVALASTSLGSMKSIKLSGLVDVMGDNLQAERVLELRLARSFRWITLVVNVISQTPLLISGLVVFAAYTIQVKLQAKPPLSTSQAFTSFAIIALLTTPAGSLLSAPPIIRSGAGLVQRIQEFLLNDSFDDRRKISDRTEPVKPLTHKSETQAEERNHTVVVEVSQLLLKQPQDDSEKNKVCQQAISFSATRGSLTTIVGPTGSGKSTFLKALLGEILPARGRIAMNTSFIGYCAQTPWLPNTRIRDAIIGPYSLEPEWYDNIIHVCALRADLARMPQNDLATTGSRGVMVSGGQKHRIALARALYSRCSILILDDLLSSLDQGTRDCVMDRLFSPAGHVKKHGLTVIMATHERQYLQSSSILVVLGTGGVIEYCGATNEWSNYDSELLRLSQTDEKSALTSTSATHDLLTPVAPVTAADPKAAVTMATSKGAAPKRQTGDWNDWMYYGKSIGPWPLALAVGFIMLSIFAINFPKLWLQWTTGSVQASVGLFVAIYALSALISVLGFAAMIYQFLLVIAPVSAVRLHDVLVKTTFRAPMSFFESTDASVMLNRFSQDMSLIDMQLPLASWNVLITAMMCLMNAVFICLGSTYLATAIPGTLLVLYFVQRFYLRTSRQMRLLDLESKSPLYQLFTETIEGQETIRAFGWQGYYNRVALERLDVSQKPYFLLYCIQRWLGFVLDCVVAALAVFLVALSTTLPQSSNGGAIGVALTSVLMFNTSLKQTITNWTQAETSLGSVSRTAAFEKDTPSEDSSFDHTDPGPQWPSKGEVDISGLTVVYTDGSAALQDISFKISAGRTFGICGRSGSGKSTLLSTLLRLIDPIEGTISIDGVDISKVDCNIVRDRIICLPQDALVFAGSFRHNLDPRGLITNDDNLIIDALRQVNLWGLVEKRGGLDADLVPQSMSHGEQQLLALARAVLRKRAACGHCILVLDEATSNLDSATEALVQAVIKEEFRASTVIVVAHRLDTVQDADTIMLLDQGHVVDIGVPAKILPQFREAFSLR